MQVRGDRPAAPGTPQHGASDQGAALFIDTALLDELSAQAKALPRLRVNRNFHQEGSDLCHRLLIALEPGSYIPPHCHLDPTKDETLLIVRGRIGALCFDAQGNITQARILEAATGCLGLTIPHGTFHSLVALEPGAVFFEAKAGPYAAPSEAERPSWAPGEQSPEAAGYCAWMRAQF
jgi:cupin fold WbuC family metalloprotein